MKYSLAKRGNPRYPERGQKVYASAQYHKVLSLDELLDYIVQHGSALKRGDFKSAIAHLAEAMAKKMAEGYKLDLDELGKFYPTLECKGADTYEDFSPDKNIKSVKVHWQPSSQFNGLRDEATFSEALNRRSERKVRAAGYRGDSIIELR